MNTFGRKGFLIALIFVVRESVRLDNGDDGSTDLVIDGTGYLSNS